MTDKSDNNRLNDTGDEESSRPELVWIGAVQDDPFYRTVAGRYSISSFENIYEALAEILLGRSVQPVGKIIIIIVIVNVRNVERGLDRFWHCLAGVSQVETALLYSLPPGVRASSNGSAGTIRTRWVEMPDQLPRILAESQRAGEAAGLAERQPVKTKPKSEIRNHKSPIAWPAESPADVADPQVDSVDSEVKTSDEHISEQAEDFHFRPARLTKEELRALLGSEFEGEADNE